MSRNSCRDCLEDGSGLCDGCYRRRATGLTPEDKCPACGSAGFSLGGNAANPYQSLVLVLGDAIKQASQGKGTERHNPNGERFEDQQIVQLCEWMGSNHFDIGQACKKAIESTGMETAAARRELLGAINYLAAAVIVLDRKEKRVL